MDKKIYEAPEMVIEDVVLDRCIMLETSDDPIFNPEPGEED